MSPTDNPAIRILVVFIAIAAGIRLIFELLEPVAPYLLAALILFAAMRLVHWYRRRW